MYRRTTAIFVSLDMQPSFWRVLPIC